jgi:hypothetical protein
MDPDSDVQITIETDQSNKTTPRALIAGGFQLSDDTVFLCIFLLLLWGLSVLQTHISIWVLKEFLVALVDSRNGTGYVPSLQHNE